VHISKRQSFEGAIRMILQKTVVKRLLLLAALALALSRFAPAQSATYASLALGYDQACVIQSTVNVTGLAVPQVLCWGNNQTGQLGYPVGYGQDNIGNNPPSSPPVPAPVQGLSGSATQLTAGNGFTCALMNGQTAQAAVQCWGWNYYETLGVNYPGDGTWQPQTIDQPSNFVPTELTQVSAGEDFVCELDAGQVYCWGSNDSQQLGPTATSVVGPGTSGFPNLVSLPRAASAISAGGAHACALVEPFLAGLTPDVYCWGSNTRAQLGSASTGNPTVVTGLLGLNVIQVSAGDDYTCALVATGSEYCWGDALGGETGTYANENGAGVIPTPTVTNFPASDGPIAALSKGSDALGNCNTSTSVEGLFCWAGPYPDEIVPSDPTTVEKAEYFGGLDGNTWVGEPLPPAVGFQFACTIASTWGEFFIKGHPNPQVPHVFCWGDNSYGQIGQGTLPPSGPWSYQLPVKVL
jgi:alpha-tubulin suppressor-like RCC1 family protein